MTLQAKRLNLTDSFRLASVISKYAEKINPQADAIDFISDVVGKLTPDEYLHCVMLMTETNEETIKQEISLDILTAFIEGLKLNQAVTLIGFYKSLGL